MPKPSRVVTTRVVDDGGLHELCQPRSDLVAEHPGVDGVFAMAEGPFLSYRRSLDVTTLVDGRHQVVETIDATLAVPFFGLLMRWPARTALRHHRRDGRQPWWAPPQRIDARAATALGVLSLASIIVGFLNTLLTQTIAFAADEFAVADRSQGVALSVVRGGILVAVVLVSLADRKGRRGVIVLASTAGPLIAATGALAPSLVWLTASQVVARPIAIALGIVIGIVAVEEMPERSRAYAISVLAMATALGAGMCVMVLPLADVGVRGWRLVYLVPLAGLALVPAIASRLPESRRFLAPHPDVAMAGHGRRFWLLAVSGMLLGLLVSPASSFQNRYLRRERGFSASRISLFTLATNTPGGIGIVVGGRLADLRGRRLIGAIALFGGSLATVAVFWTAGWPMWAWSTAGSIVGAAAVPALGVYSAELFPTSLRGRANGALGLTGLIGSTVGLIFAGAMVDDSGRFGPAMAILGTGPLLVCVLVLVAYPETAGVALEEINPEDASRGTTP